MPVQKFTLHRTLTFCRSHGLLLEAELYSNFVCAIMHMEYETYTEDIQQCSGTDTMASVT